jgi:hypothetical protein
MSVKFARPLRKTAIFTPSAPLIGYKATKHNNIMLNQIVTIY